MSDTFAFEVICVVIGIFAFICYIFLCVARIFNWQLCDVDDPDDAIEITNGTEMNNVS